MDGDHMDVWRYREKFLVFVGILFYEFRSRKQEMHQMPLFHTTSKQWPTG